MIEVPTAARAELHALYRDLDAALAPFRRGCEVSGRCCHFAAYEHMLFVTGLEAAEMVAAGRAPDARLAAAGTCPYLDGARCGIREHRALGCRIFFCDRTFEAERNALYEAFLKRVREIEARHGLPTRYLPVTRAFAEASA